MNAMNPSAILADPAVNEASAPDMARIWAGAFLIAARHYRLPVSPEQVRQDARWADVSASRNQLALLARAAGLRIRFLKAMPQTVSQWELPLIVQLQGGHVAVILSVNGAGMAGAMFSGAQDGERPVALAEIAARAELVVSPRPVRNVADARVDATVPPLQRDWLSRIVMIDARAYAYVLVAALVANVLGLAGILFSMQVYDRVVPAQSMPTLYVLASGVALAILFDFIIRRARMNLIDILGKRADLRLSDLVFGHALRVRADARPPSTGAFVAQLRDLDQLREMLTSTVVGAVVDLPFVLLFLAILWHIAGGLVSVPLCAIVLLLWPGLLLQPALRECATEASREASLRNALLFEAMQGVEDIKTLQAEPRFQSQWNHLNAVTGAARLRQRAIVNGLGAWAANVQMLAYAAMVFFGAPLVIAGDMTTGALVGASMLASRMIAPMTQYAGLMNRLQQAKVAKAGLDQIMRLPADHPRHENRIHRPAIMGAYRLKAAVFGYQADMPPALIVPGLTIRPGETIAVLGRTGAGKSTLLQALCGLLPPGAGEITLDGVALGQIDPADIRRDVSLLSQNARLFHGTIRDNLTLGAPDADEAAILAMLEMTGAADFVRARPRGLDTLLFERGETLSGGQRQSLLLARTLLRPSPVLLLDEPTAAMDEASEQRFATLFRHFCQDRTVVFTTHRPRLLELAGRLLVVESGRLVLDDTMEAGLKKMREGQGGAPREAGR